jgi:hypothetical protein
MKPLSGSSHSFYPVRDCLFTITAHTFHMWTLYRSTYPPTWICAIAAYKGLNIIKHVAVIRSCQRRLSSLKLCFSGLLHRIELFSLNIFAVYNRPFSSFSFSFWYPPESSPRTLKVEAGRPSATSESTANSTWCKKPADDLLSNTRCERLNTYITHLITSFTHALVLTRAKSGRRNEAMSKH